MMGVAFDEKFDACCSILDGDDRGRGSEINDVPRRLVLSLFTFFTDIPDSGLTAGPFQFQRELQGSFWTRTFFMH